VTKLPPQNHNWLSKILETPGGEGFDVAKEFAELII
jgi:hypothetical protein